MRIANMPIGKMVGLCVLALATVRMPLLGEIAGAFPVEKSEICRALSVAAAACESEIELLVVPIARQRHPVLRWTVERQLEAGEMIRVGCESAACVPFLVHRRTNMVREEDGQHRREQRREIAKLPVAVRAGTLLTLIQSGDGMRMTMTVVSLSAGRVGDLIRVREYGGTRCLHSIVADPHTVIASF